jgi:hypothetical protein
METGNTLIALGIAFMFSAICLGQTANFAEISGRLGDPAKQYRCKGASMVDFDRDGDDDIFITKTNGRNLLFENQGDGQFVEVAYAKGIHHGNGSFMGIWGDFDNDGHLDLYVGNYQSSDVLYRNNGDNTFGNVSYQAGIYNPGRTLTVNLADIDNDGFLDIFVGNFNEKNKLYRNNGDFTFTEVAQEVGITDISYTMGAMFFDYDNDGDQDLYITHDNNAPNLLYQNDGSGHFTDVAQAAGANVRANGMGVDFGDINNDGLLDMYIVNLFANNLLLNNGNGTFTDITDSSQADDVGMGWGTTFLDFNNDGLEDIYITNDTYFTNNPRSPNVLFQNMGNNIFSKAEEGQPISSFSGSYGIGTGDIDKDGFVDVCIANNGSSDINQLFLNSNSLGNWFGITLEGTNSNRAAIGARVQARDDKGILHTDEVAGGTGYSSQNSLTIHFGLADASSLDSLTIRWPSGLVQTFQAVAANKYYGLKEGNELEELPSNLSTAAHQAPRADFSCWLFNSPADGKAELLLALPSSSQLSLSISDVQGRVLRSKDLGALGSGQHHIAVETSGLANGICFLSIRNERAVLTKKLLVLNN